MVSITINREILANALESVAGAVPTKPIHPVLGLFYLEGESGSLKVRGFDLSIGVQCAIPIASMESFKATLPKSLLSMLCLLKAEEIELELEVTDIFVHTLKTEATQTKLYGLDPSEYPDFPTSSEDGCIDFPTDVFISACKRLAHISSIDPTKHILCGINIEGVTDGDHKQLHFGATDGHRLGFVKEDADIDFPPKTFPVSGLNEIIKVAKQANQEVLSLSFSEDSLFVRMGDYSVYTRMLSGDYPQYKNLIPKKFANCIEVDSRELLTALKFVTVMESPRVTLVIENDVLTVEAIAVDKGTSRVAVKYDPVKGSESAQLTFNSKYLLDAIKHLTGELKISFNEPSTPVVLTSYEMSDFQYLLMPINITQ